MYILLKKPLPLLFSKPLFKNKIQEKKKNIEVKKLANVCLVCNCLLPFEFYISTNNLRSATFNQE